MSCDYRTVFEELSKDDGFEQIFFVGYSMGGNLVTKMAGEFGADVPKALRGVCAVCPALDLAACADALERWDNYLYQRRFVNGLMSRYARKQKRSEEHTSELQSHLNLVCRLLLEKKKQRLDHGT